ncbi:RluA family pseudouridine synthase [Thalassotalea sp. PLHSN55]|uniref:RluA family pseudouridine synthase n=1 Tax=Thalassotalea sp. PLHSN55 TaxID=3435888 RepID=UPI003F85CED6
MKFERHLTIDPQPSALIATLAQHCQLSNAQLKQAITKGALWLRRGKHTQRLRRLKKELQPGDQLHFYYNEAVLAQTCAPAQLIADYKDYSIWYKPYGMLSQGSKWSDHLTISRYVEQHITPQRPSYIVHRLDKAATGLIVIAHSKKAARALSAMFEHHQLDKHYHIIVHGDHSKFEQPQTITLAIDDKKATSHFSQLDYDASHDLSLVEVVIESGRKHQIRKHAKSIGLPVVGDRLHGDELQHYPEMLNLQLCAVKIAFACPLSGKQISHHLPPDLTPQLEQVITLLNE